MVAGFETILHKEHRKASQKWSECTEVHVRSIIAENFGEGHISFLMRQMLNGREVEVPWGFIRRRKTNQEEQ